MMNFAPAAGVCKLKSDAGARPSSPFSAFILTASSQVSKTPAWACNNLCSEAATLGFFPTPAA